jgi:hypothetical protein
MIVRLLTANCQLKTANCELNNFIDINKFTLTATRSTPKITRNQ